MHRVLILREEGGNVAQIKSLIVESDENSDENTRKDLKTLPVFPTKTLQEHPSLAYCEDRVIEHYTQIKGLTRGQAIVQYMKVVEALPTYGVHYYGVKRAAKHYVLQKTERNLCKTFCNPIRS
ncbi:hypothetical protein QYF61_007883 [Mycteria americana]|uniref:FERM domain-containing protein n=1 Tax=Mycteria americana TaxID=33587 RepID=A0AAN7MS72_MYCAM|nr:hypothetical protein QYF61_007883 [Mycteria americana]